MNETRRQIPTTVDRFNHKETIRPKSLDIPLDVMKQILCERIDRPHVAVKFGKEKSDEFIEAIVVDTDEAYDPAQLQEELTFEESKQLREFFTDASEYRVPLVYIQLLRLADKKGVLLATLDIRDSERGKGIGSSIQEQLGAVVRELGFDYIAGEAVDDAALTFNQKSGFEVLEPGSRILQQMQRQGFGTDDDIAEGKFPIVRYV